jgi:hypothetical protein
MNNFIVAVQN